MSRAFTKEHDDDPAPEPVAPPRGPYYVTQETLDALLATDERRERAQLVVPRAGIASFGTNVTVRDERGIESTYGIVNDEDADPVRGSVGISSPLAQALIGKHTGEKATWHRPIGDATLRIEKISYNLTN